MKYNTQAHTLRSEGVPPKEMTQQKRRTDSEEREPLSGGVGKQRWIHPDHTQVRFFLETGSHRVFQPLGPKKHVAKQVQENALCVFQKVDCSVFFRGVSWKWEGRPGFDMNPPIRSRKGSGGRTTPPPPKLCGPGDRFCPGQKLFTSQKWLKMTFWASMAKK